MNKRRISPPKKSPAAKFLKSQMKKLNKMSNLKYTKYAKGSKKGRTV